MSSDNILRSLPCIHQTEQEFTLSSPQEKNITSLYIFNSQLFSFKSLHSQINSVCDSWGVQTFLSQDVE